MRRVRRDERGSSLIIALVFLAVFSLWLTATLSSTQSGLHIAQTMSAAPQRLYASDGSIEKAIQLVRYDGPKGVEGDNTCGTTLPLNGKNYYVQCTPQTGSGISPNGGSSPSLGIIALSTGAGGEVGFTQRKNGVIKIDGGVFSNYGISFQNGSVCPGTNCQQLNLCPNNAKTVTDAVFVGAGSNPNTPTKTVSSLSAGFVNNATETDVGVPIGGNAKIPGGATIAGVVGATSVTMSATAGSVGLNQKVTFRENYPPYNNQCHPDATSHGDLRVVGQPCSESNAVAVTFHCNASPLDPLNLSDPQAPPDATTFAARTIPACPSGKIVDFQPGRYTDVVGLNNLTSSCNGKVFVFNPGTYDFDFSGAASPAWYMGNSSSWIVGGEKTFDPAKTTTSNTGLLTGGMSKSSTTLQSATSVFKSTDVGSYVSGGIEIAAGAKITGYTNATTVTLDKAPDSKITGGLFAVTGKTADATCNKGTGAADHAGAEFIFSGPSRVSMGDMRFEMCAPASGTHQQNAIYGAKTNIPGGLVAQNGCVTATPYPGAGCALVSTESNRSPVFIVHGTIYAPLAAVDLAVKNFSYQAVSRGIVARVVALEMFPNAVFTDPVIYSPDFGTVAGADREMLFTAHECPSLDPCDNPKLRAMVRFRDHDELNNTIIGFKVLIESWTVLR